MSPTLRLRCPTRYPAHRAKYAPSFGWSTLRSIRLLPVLPTTGGADVRRLRLLGLTATLGVLAITLSGCSWYEALKLGWPDPITPEGRDNLKLWIGCLIAALVVGVIVWGFMFWASAFHRHKKTATELPRQFGYNMALELVLT